MNKLLLHAATWINLMDIILSLKKTDKKGILYDLIYIIHTNFMKGPNHTVLIEFRMVITLVGYRLGDGTR